MFAWCHRKLKHDVHMRLIEPEIDKDLYYGQDALIEEILRRH